MSHGGSLDLRRFWETADRPALLAILGLLAVSLVTLYSVTHTPVPETGGSGLEVGRGIFYRQIIWMAIGLGALLVGYTIPFRLIEDTVWVQYGLVLALLVAVLWNPSNLFHVVSSKQTRAAAQAMGIRVQFLKAQSLSELSDAFAAMAKDRPQAVIVFADRFFLHNRARVADFALERRLPAVVTHQELVESGALMSFGANYPDMHRRAASYVDKILKGAKAGDLPIEQPTKFELLLNMRTARALGITVPPSLVLRADRVIE